MSNFLDFDFTDSKNINNFIFDDEVNKLFQDDVYYSYSTYNTETTSYLTNIETTNYYIEYNDPYEWISELLEAIYDATFFTWLAGG